MSVLIMFFYTYCTILPNKSNQIKLLRVVDGYLWHLCSQVPQTDGYAGEE